MKIEITDEELEAYRKALELNPYMETGVYGGRMILDLIVSMLM